MDAHDAMMKDILDGCGATVPGFSAPRLTAHLIECGWTRGVSVEAVIESLTSLVDPKHASDIAMLFTDAFNTCLDEIRALVPAPDGSAEEIRQHITWLSDALEPVIEAFEHERNADDALAIETWWKPSTHFRIRLSVADFLRIEAVASALGGKEGKPPPPE